MTSFLIVALLAGVGSGVVASVRAPVVRFDIECLGVATLAAAASFLSWSRASIFGAAHPAWAWTLAGTFAVLVGYASARLVTARLVER